LKDAADFFAKDRLTGETSTWIPSPSIKALPPQLTDQRDEDGPTQSPADYPKASFVAFREAPNEYTRERVPLDWAMIQNNLGAALAILGE